MDFHRIWKIVACLLFAAMACSLPLVAQEKGVLGYWKEPGGSVIHIETCGKEICATLVEISASAASRIDGKNPAPALRNRSLCGVRLGEGFHLASTEKAEGGTFYDPKSGKTYHGLMTSHQDTLDLRGYIGFSLLGRTERWIRTVETTSCRA